MNVSYTLFRPDGTPLRARGAVTFQSCTSEIQLAKEENRNSPDMTHRDPTCADDGDRALS